MSAVEWKPLKEIVESISTGLNPRQNFVLNDDNASLYYVTVKEISSNKIIFSENTDKISNEAKNIINKRSKLELGDILFSGIGTIGKVVYVDIPTSNWDCSESVFLLKPSDNVVSGKYLTYILLSDIAKKQYEIGANGSIMKGVRKNTLENILIPIPSLSKQQEIVSHLDTFTSLISNLESELEMRRKQYEHYRNQLLDFEGVEKLPLSEVFEMRGGYTPSTKNGEYWEDGTIPWFRMEDIRENGNILGDSTLHITSMAVKKNGLFPKNSIILATSATIGVHALLTVPALSNQRFTAFYPKEKFEDKVNYKYTYYVFYIIDEWCKNNTVQGGFASVDMTGLRKYLFPIPSLAKQAEIVSKLDAFENLIQSLEEEIKLRKQQYQYYREKLLTFE